MIANVMELWDRRSLIHTLTTANLKLVHRNTLLGYLWWLLDPIMMTAVYAVVVGMILGRGQHVPAYPAFVMCGVASWKCFSSTITQAINSMISGEPLIKTFRFPRAALPVSLVISNHMLFAFAFIPLILLSLVYAHVIPTEGITVTWTVVYVPLILFIQFVLALGAGLMFSCFGVFFRDLSNIMSHVLRVMWYMSPGLYRITDVIENYEGMGSLQFDSFRVLFVFNPFAHIMESYREAVMYGSTPDMWGLAYALVFGVVCVFLGFIIFQSQERKFAKAI